MVGQRFVSLLEHHPWFEVVKLAASPRSAGKTYREALGSRWAMPTPVPASMADLVMYDASDVEKMADGLDFVFCAVDMKKDEIRALEERYAKAECPVISNNSAHRFTPDVPMIIPEINADHMKIIDAQRRRLGTKRGFIAVKSNCSLQSYVPALEPLRDFGEEEKSEKEPMKIWGTVEGDEIRLASSPSITTQCIRVPVTDGHLAAVFVRFDHKPSKEEILRRWKEFAGEPQRLNLPSAPKQFLTYFEEDNMPQTRLNRDQEHGMGVSIGRLREDSQYDYKFVCLSHNTIRGAAGGAVLMAELLAENGYL